MHSVVLQSVFALNVLKSLLQINLQGHRTTEQVPSRVPDAQRAVEAGPGPDGGCQGQDQDFGRARLVHSHRICQTVSVCTE